MSAKDFYAILGVRREATGEEIRAAYRDRARHYLHGCNLEGAALVEWLQSLRAAWDTLSDPSRRAEYDTAHQASSDNGQVPESPDSPEQLKRRIAELEAELVRVRRQRDKYYHSMYQLAGSQLSTDRLEDLIGQSEGTPIVKLLSEFEGSLKE